jgi:uncharacterized protein (TIGR03067 family)
MRIALVPFLGMFVALALLRAGDAPSDLQRMQGVWKVIHLEEKGKKLPDKELSLMDAIIKKDTVTIRIGNEVGAEFIVKIDSKQKPKAVDFTHTLGPDKGKTELGIYSLEEDILKFCVEETKKERPQSFEGPATASCSVMILKRKG